MEQRPDQFNAEVTDLTVWRTEHPSVVGDAAGREPNAQAGEPEPAKLEPKRDPEIDKVFRGVPEIYVASLADYNAGKYHGAWIDATHDPEEIAIRIATMLRHSPVLRSEGESVGDWAIHDSEGFGGIQLDEHEDPAYINAVGTAIAEFGDAFAAWVDINGLPQPRDPETLTQHFRDAYLGQFANLDDYGEQLWEEMGWQALVDSVLPPDVARHTALSGPSLANDLWLEGAIQIAHTSGGRIWIFRGI